MNNYCYKCGANIGDNNFCPCCGTKRYTDKESQQTQNQTNTNNETPLPQEPIYVANQGSANYPNNEVQQPQKQTYVGNTVEFNAQYNVEEQPVMNQNFAAEQSSNQTAPFSPPVSEVPKPEKNKAAVVVLSIIALIAVVSISLGAYFATKYFFSDSEHEQQETKITENKGKNSGENGTEQGGGKTIENDDTPAEPEKEYVIPADFLRDIDWDLTLEDLEEKNYLRVTERVAEEVRVDKLSVEGLSQEPVKVNLLVDSDLKATAYFITMSKYDGVFDELKSYFDVTFNEDNLGGKLDYTGMNEEEIVGITESDTSSMVYLIVSKRNVSTNAWTMMNINWESKPEEISRYKLTYKSRDDEYSRDTYVSYNSEFYDLYKGSFSVNYLFDEDGLSKMYLDLPYDEKLFEKSKTFFNSESFDLGSIFDSESAKGRIVERGIAHDTSVFIEHLKDENVIRYSFCSLGSLYIP